MKTVSIITLIVLLAAGCSFLPDEPENITLQSQELQDIVYGTWRIDAVVDPARYTDSEWHSMDQYRETFTFYLDGRFVHKSEQFMLSEKSFAVSNAESKIMLGVPNGEDWTVTRFESHVMEMERNEGDRVRKIRLMR